MTIRKFAGKTPEIAISAYIDETALLVGDVTVGADSSIWPMTVARGDVHSITIGKCTNIQDASILHVTHDGKFSPGGHPLVVGDNVTVGHRVTLHACRVGNNCLIGMSATIMDGVELGDGLIIGAGALVPTGKKLEGGYLYVGSPARRVRELNDKEREFLDYSAKHYVKLKNKYRQFQ